MHKSVAGGELAPGWQMRVDPRAGSGTPAKFVAMGSGFHATSGSRAIYWRPGDVATGNYKVSATFTLTKPPGHAEAYGLIFAGKDLTSPNQNYMYFTLGGNGTYLIKHRAGDADSQIHTIQDWTPSDAIAKADASGKSTDKLEVVVGAQKIQYLINGKEVYSMDRAKAVGRATCCRRRWQRDPVSQSRRAYRRLQDQQMTESRVGSRESVVDSCWKRQRDTSHSEMCPVRL